MVRIDIWDSVFVRARRADVHPLLADVAGYTRWWPGLRVRPLGPDRLELGHRPSAWPTSWHRVAVRVLRVRPDLGVDFAVSGDLRGEAEWYYLDEVDGTVVHYLVRATTARRRHRRLVAAHRASVRAALHTVKDRLEGARAPGAEPVPELLADQQRAIAAFRAGVEAHARRVAAARDQTSGEAV